MNPVCVTIFGANNLSEVQWVDCSKSETLFNAINEKFVKGDIHWQNVISVGFDNTSANMGIRNSVKSRIITDCSCRLVQLQLVKLVPHITKKPVVI